MRPILTPAAVNRRFGTKAGHSYLLQPLSLVVVGSTLVEGRHRGDRGRIVSVPAYPYEVLLGHGIKISSVTRRGDGLVSPLLVYYSANVAASIYHSSGQYQAHSP
jgi:hypothetical protein